MATLKRFQTSTRRKSPIARITASETERAKLLTVQNSVLPKGFALPQHVSHWQDYLIQGAISVEAYFVYVMGSKVMGHSQSFDSGVRRRKGDDLTAPILDMNRFGTKGWETFSKLPQKEQIAQLVKWGIAS